MKPALVFALALAALSLSHRARAGDDAPTSTSTEYSALEKRIIERTLIARGFVLETAPAGKILEDVEYQPLEVFDDDDPVPDQLNVFHTHTREWILAREVLLPVGATWNQALVDETARNLRNLDQISLAVAVPIRGSKPGTVRLLLIVRDIWSLRPDWDLSFTGGRLNYLLFQPTESNLAGIHHEPQLVFLYQPLSLQTGAAYAVPRIGQSHIGASATAGVFLPLGPRSAVDSEDPEGSYGSLTVTQPLYSSRAEWSWVVSGHAVDYVNRTYENGELKQFVATNPDGTTTAVPFQWRAKSFTANVGLTRSFGWSFKNDIAFGFKASLLRYTPEGAEGIAVADVDQFVHAAIPTTENRVYPYARWHTYRTDFFRTIEVEALGIQEDFRLGHDVYLEVDPVSRALGSSRSLVSVLGGAMWTSRIGDGLARASIEGSVDTQTDGTVSDALLDGKVGIVSPRTGFGRLVFSGRYTARPDNYLNKIEFIGGDTRLRGYPSSSFYGDNLVAMNLEWRTRGLYKFGMAMGGVVFYDSGDAYNSLSQLKLKHSVGAGLRFLLPFFDDVAYRVDFAIPLNRDALPSTAGRVDVIIAIEQAFPFPDLCANASNSIQVARQCP